jgi:MFS family permease
MSERKHPPPWLFAVIGLPYGAVNAFSAAIMPFLADAHGIKLKSISWFTLLLYVPAILQFLYAPIVDVGFTRRVWLIITSALGAVCLGATFLVPLPEGQTLFLAFGFAAAALAALVSACIGGVLAVTMPDEKRGAAGGWYNVGNLSGSGVTGFVAIEMIGREVSPVLIAGTIAAMMVLPSLAVLAVYEPPRDHIKKLGEVFGVTLHDVKQVLFSKTGLTGIALCISPVGTAALTNFFAAMKTDYGASDDMVAFVTGGASSVVTAIGALGGGFLCDRFNRRAMYLSSGVLTAICGIAMAIAPKDPTAFAVGATVYNLVTGFCFSAFTATVLETIGTAGKAASTQYALFVSAGNAAIAYTGVIDTQFKDSHGIGGVLTADAVLNLLGVAILGLAFWRLGSFGKRRSFSRLDLGSSDDKHDAAP